MYLCSQCSHVRIVLKTDSQHRTAHLGSASQIWTDYQHHDKQEKHIILPRTRFYELCKCQSSYSLCFSPMLMLSYPYPNLRKCSSITSACLSAKMLTLLFISIENFEAVDFTVFSSIIKGHIEQCLHLVIPTLFLLVLCSVTGTWISFCPILGGLLYATRGRGSFFEVFNG